MMTVLGVVFSALAVVLVVSGVLKLADPAPTAAMLRQLSPATRRLPVWLIGGCELSLGAAALIVGGRAIAVLIAIAYAAFTAVSIVLLHRGDGVPCGCLGSRSAPASSAHVLADSGAALLAALAAVADVPGALAGPFTAAGLLRLAVASLIAALVIAVLRIWPAKPAAAPGSDGPPPKHFGLSDEAGTRAAGSGTSAPAGPSGSLASVASTAPPPSCLGATAGHAMEGMTPAGEPLMVAVGGTEQKTLLAFLSANCGTCLPLWRELGTRHIDAFAARATEVVLVTHGPEQVDPTAVAAVAPPRPLTIMSSQAWERYEVPWIPYFILVEGYSSAILAKGTAQSWDRLLALVTGDEGTPAGELATAAEEYPKSWIDPRVETIGSGTYGHGLVAREPFQTGEVVIVLAGLHASASRAEMLVSRNMAAARPIPLDDDTYLVQAPNDRASYVNHSCDPSIWLEEDFSLVARRDIGAGNELTIDYATVIVDPGWEMACQCGAADCRGLIRGEDWKLPSLRTRYADHFAPGIARFLLDEPDMMTD